jgi:O-antigen/teichoic acid export membrane protein
VSWRLGQWILASHITMMISRHVVLWLLVLLESEEATGLFIAPMSMVMFINPFLMGLTNVFLPASASALATGGREDVRSRIRAFTRFLAPIMSVFCVVVCLFGSDILPLLYGPAFAGLDTTVILLGLAIVVGTMGIPANIGLWVYEKTRATFFCSSVGFAVTAIVTFLTIPSYSIVGAGIGLLAGETCTASLRWWVWARSQRPVRIRDAAADAEHEMTT